MPGKYFVHPQWPNSGPTPPSDSVNIRTGVYSIAPKHATGMRLDIQGGSKESGANAYIWSNAATAANYGAPATAQQFAIARSDSGAGYRITAQCSGLSLDLSGGEYAPGANVQQYTPNEWDAQRWTFQDAGGHHYTLDAGEKDSMVDAGWVDEGIGWYSDVAETVPLFREYNPNMYSCNHNYTTDKTEHENLISLGWRDEGIAWYGLPDSAVEAAKGSSLSMDDPLDVHDVNELISAFTEHRFLANGGAFSRDDIRKGDLEMLAYWVYRFDPDSFKWGEDGARIARVRGTVSACDAITLRYLGVAADWALDPLAGNNDFSGYKDGYVYTSSSTAKQWGSASTVTAIADAGGGRFRIAFETTTWDNIYANYMVDGFLDMIDGRSGKEGLAHWLTRDEFERYAGTLGRTGEAVVEVTFEGGAWAMRLVSMTIDPS